MKRPPPKQALVGAGQAHNRAEALRYAAEAQRIRRANRRRLRRMLLTA
jgi:hypothetical protein